MDRVAILAWLDERTGLSVLREVAAHKTVPQHRHSLWYYLGGMTLFFFFVQVGTGIMLMLYYRPSAEEAYESVQFIMTRVQFGWLIRSIHSWSANLMVGTAMVHLFSVFFLKAYRRPRELTWMSGVLLLFLALGFGFSGYLLPWNELAFFATKVGTDIAGSVPLIGEWVLRFLRGGDRVTGATLSRFYGWHVAILPAVTAALLGLHLLLVQKHGMSVPPGVARAGPGKTMPFLPNFLLRDLFGWTVALAVLAALAAYAPWELGRKADPFAPAPADIRPEWYFLFMFETLKKIPGGEVLGIEYEALAIMAYGAAALVLFLVPFLDRTPESGMRARAFTWAGWAALAYIAIMTAVGSHSLWPVFLPVGFLVLAALWGRRGAAAVVVGATVLLSGAGSESRAAAQEAAGAASGERAAGAAPRTGAETRAAAPEESCITCHRAFKDDVPNLYAPLEVWEEDIHRARDLGCVGCHGGDGSADAADDAERAMSAARGFVARPARAKVAEFCGRCHADAAFMKKYNPAARVDQVAEYRTSVHGQRNARGDANVATCTDCHGVHGIRQSSSPKARTYPINVPDTCGACHSDAARMSPYGRKGDPVADWRTSVHAESLLKRGDLAAPACNDCHGNHGAVPPGVTSVAFVCGQCHGREAALFRESFKKALFDATGAGECVTCHGNHAIPRPGDHLIGTGEGTTCAQCHQPGDACDQQSIRMRAAIDRYAKELEEARALLERAEHAGMEVSEAVFNLKNEGVSGLVETRALVHSFDTDRLVKRAEEGIEAAARGRAAGEAALAELQFRRKGLAVSVAFIGVLLVGLYLKIREVDRP